MEQDNRRTPSAPTGPRLNTDIYAENEDMTSVVSNPYRRPEWGESGYRGNCDGTLIKDLILRYEANSVADPMMGSGTSRDVVEGINRARGSAIAYWGGDLKTGFDLRRDDIPGRYDLVWIHPPYWDIVRYSEHPADLSRCLGYDEFVSVLADCLRRCRKALNPGGRLAVLVGDVRKGGRYWAIVRDVLNLEGDLGELRSVIVKVQHNVSSDRKRYGRLEDVPIKHEYCVVFKNTEALRARAA